ncbi:hypothetical protein BAUCODRAFT_503953 [Baudoinia panamericana UAMH 10762]|uniref:Uncharacterized protein n=1 Tax=Baudoinia panamericana (strain UAMH 10762) TaxID=717646 RepID=M2MGN5_BAUPA|nr:uncharacterized protein BAUCODRAFT_503953 [Baudoinia panamericana UAMH 10762]EMC95796.1 hypothetical protein BAUCODRAFT_503953 [Baudoinia panamericana UAMH 10762]
MPLFWKKKRTASASHISGTGTAKRKAVDDVSDGSPSFKKRVMSTLGFDNGMQLVRKTVSGKNVPIEKTLEVFADEDEEYNDAQEELEDGARASDGGLPSANSSYQWAKEQEAHDGAPDGRDNEQEGYAVNTGEDEDADREHDVSVDNGNFIVRSGSSGVEDADDLFSVAFGTNGKRASQVRSSAVNDEPEDDDEVMITHVIPKPKPNHQTKQLASAHNPIEHARGCKPNRSPSTPAPPSLPDLPKHIDPTTLQPIPATPNPEKDLRKPLARHQRLHDRALAVRPKLFDYPNYPDHRYPIAVLHLDNRKKLNALTEKDFSWLKGNRQTCMKTIAEAYANTTLAEDFCLVLAGERLGEWDRCEEIDYFGDKMVVLRAVKEGTEMSKGTDLGHGCPMVVIEID